MTFVIHSVSGILVVFVDIAVVQSTNRLTRHGQGFDFSEALAATHMGEAAAH